MYHLLMITVKFVVFDSDVYVIINMSQHKDMDSAKTIQLFLPVLNSCILPLCAFCVCSVSLQTSGMSRNLTSVLEMWPLLVKTYLRKL